MNRLLSLLLLYSLLVLKNHVRTHVCSDSEFYSGSVDLYVIGGTLLECSHITHKPPPTQSLGHKP